MPLLPTPGYFSCRAHFYQQLAQLTAAGLTLPAALELQRRSPPARGLRPALDVILSELHQGSTFGDAVGAATRSLDPFDVALLRSGEHSGRLPACFQILGEHYETNARLLRQVISALLYPALLVHLAILLAPLPQLVLTGNVAAYLTGVLGALIPIYLVVAGIAWLTGGTHRGRWQAATEAVLRWVPIFGKARRNLAVARLSSALEALISAGVPILQAWELAGAACGSAALGRAIERWKPLVENGVTPAEALQQSPEFPEVFVSLYHTGEVSGSLDDTLRRLQVLHQEEGSRQMRALAEWTPKLIYFGIVLLVAWQVISFWTGYFSSIGNF